MKDLVEKKLSSRHVFEGELLDVWSDTVQLPNRRTSIREYIKHPGAVVIIPVLPDERIMLIRQFRYPTGEVEIELPAGKIDPGESPMATVQRELAEETGFTAQKITLLMEIHPCMGYSTERMWVFLARDLEKTTALGDSDEFIEKFSLPIHDCLDWVYSGKIKDIKAIIGIFWAERILSGKWVPPNPDYT